jgi:hypothetical protein
MVNNLRSVDDALNFGPYMGPVGLRGIAISVLFRNLFYRLVE